MVGLDLDGPGPGLRAQQAARDGWKHQCTCGEHNLVRVVLAEFETKRSARDLRAQRMLR